MDYATRVQSITPSSTLAITAKANALRADGYNVISLGAGEPDFNTPKDIIDAAFEAASSGQTKYTPTSGILALKKAIVAKLADDQGLSYQENNIIITTGAKHALYLIFQALLNPGDEVIVPTPYWVSYPEQVKLADGVPVFVEGLEENQYKITAKRLEQAINRRTKALIINSPSNPTGMIYTEEELREIGRVCLRHGVVVISDEIYEKLVYHGEAAPSIAAAFPDIKPQTIIVNGVSKSHAMTGWRIGYAVGDAGLIKAMTNVASHSTSNPSTISQYAALKAYTGSQETVEKMRQAFEKRLDVAYERLIQIPGIKCQKPKGAFYLFANAREAAEMSGFKTVSDWVSALLEEAQVALIPGEGFGAPDYVRLSYATSEEQMLEAMDRIAAFMENHTK
jgi:aspartate aminotransferase